MTASEEAEATALLEDSDAPEEAVAGGTSVSIELAGLPVGGSDAVAEGDAWCQVLFWREQLPAGVELDINAVTILDSDASTLLPDSCQQTPPCVGTIITADSTDGCTVMVRPASPQTPSVTVRLDGTLRCPDQETCTAVGAEGGAASLIANPAGIEEDSGGQTTEDSAGTGGDGSEVDRGNTGGDPGVTDAATPTPTT